MPCYYRLDDKHTSFYELENTKRCDLLLLLFRNVFCVTGVSKMPDVK